MRQDIRSLSYQLDNCRGRTAINSSHSSSSCRSDEMMMSQTVLDRIIFRLTPTRTRFDLYAVAGSVTEKLASGLVTPFLCHLQTAEEQFRMGGYSIKLEPADIGVNTDCNASSWFTKGTVERFVRFVNSPDVIERVITIESEIVELEDRIGMHVPIGAITAADDPLSVLESPCSYSTQGGTWKAMSVTERSSYSMRIREMHENGSMLGKNSREQLLGALDARRFMLQKEQGMAFARAAAAGFVLVHLMQLIVFSDCFRAVRLKEACTKFVGLCQKRKMAGFGAGDDAIDEELVAAVTRAGCTLFFTTKQLNHGGAIDENLLISNRDSPKHSDGELGNSTVCARSEEIIAPNASVINADSFRFQRRHDEFGFNRRTTSEERGFSTAIAIDHLSEHISPDRQECRSPPQSVAAPPPNLRRLRMISSSRVDGVCDRRLAHSHNCRDTTMDAYGGDKSTELEENGSYNNGAQSRFAVSIVQHLTEMVGDEHGSPDLQQKWPDFSLSSDDYRKKLVNRITDNNNMEYGSNLSSDDDSERQLVMRTRKMAYDTSCSLLFSDHESDDPRSPCRRRLKKRLEFEEADHGHEKDSSPNRNLQNSTTKDMSEKLLDLQQTSHIFDMMSKKALMVNSSSSDIVDAKLPAAAVKEKESVQMISSAKPSVIDDNQIIDISFERQESAECASSDLHPTVIQPLPSTPLMAEERVKKFVDQYNEKKKEVKWRGSSKKGAECSSSSNNREKTTSSWKVAIEKQKKKAAEMEMARRAESEGGRRLMIINGVDDEDHSVAAAKAADEGVDARLHNNNYMYIATSNSNSNSFCSSGRSPRDSVANRFKRVDSSDAVLLRMSEGRSKSKSKSIAHDDHQLAIFPTAAAAMAEEKTVTSARSIDPAMAEKTVTSARSIAPATAEEKTVTSARSIAAAMAEKTLPSARSISTDLCSSISPTTAGARFSAPNARLMAASNSIAAEMKSNERRRALNRTAAATPRSPMAMASSKQARTYAPLQEEKEYADGMVPTTRRKIDSSAEAVADIAAGSPRINGGAEGDLGKKEDRRRSPGFVGSIAISAETTVDLRHRLAANQITTTDVMANLAVDEDQNKRSNGLINPVVDEGTAEAMSKSRRCIEAEAEVAKQKAMAMAPDADEALKDESSSGAIAIAIAASTDESPSPDASCWAGITLSSFNILCRRRSSSAALRIRNNRSLSSSSNSGHGQAGNSTKQQQKALERTADLDINNNYCRATHTPAADRSASKTLYCLLPFLLCSKSHPISIGSASTVPVSHDNSDASDCSSKHRLQALHGSPCSCSVSAGDLIDGRDLLTTTNSSRSKSSSMLSCIGSIDSAATERRKNSKLSVLRNFRWTGTQSRAS